MKLGTRSVLVGALLALSCGGKTSTAKLDAAKSTVTADKTTATANGTDEITLTITTVDTDGAPFNVSGATVNMTGDGNNFDQPTGGSSQGVMSCRVRSEKAEAKTITVSVKVDGADVSLPGSQAVTFVPGPVESIKFTTQPSNVQVGAAMSPAIVVTAFDGKGNVTADETLLIALRITGNNVPNIDGGVGSTDGGVVVFDSVTFDGPGTDLGMQARCQGCSQPWADDATAHFNVTQ